MEIIKEFIIILIYLFHMLIILWIIVSRSVKCTANTETYCMTPNCRFDFAVQCSTYCSCFRGVIKILYFMVFSINLDVNKPCYSNRKWSLFGILLNILYSQIDKLIRIRINWSANIYRKI